MSAPFRLESGDHDHVGYPPRDRVIARRALVGLGGVDRLQNTHIEVVVRPGPDARNEVSDIARSVIGVEGHPGRGYPPDWSFRSSFPHRVTSELGEQRPGEQRNGEEQGSNNEIEVSRTASEFSIRIEPHTAILSVLDVRKFGFGLCVWRNGAALRAGVAKLSYRVLYVDNALGAGVVGLTSLASPQGDRLCP